MRIFTATEEGGFRIHTLPTKKYKTNTFILQLAAPLSEDTVTARALLAYVLQSATAYSPTTRLLRKRLDELYGATLSVQPIKKGNFHVLSFQVEVANENYLRESSALLEKAIALLAEILLQPKLENNVFDPDIVKKEKRSLIQRIRSVKDDKIRYANQRLIEEMYRNEPYRLLVYGKEEEVDRISENDLTTIYKHGLQTDAIDLFVIGDVDPDEVSRFVKNSFRLPEGRKPDAPHAFSDTAVIEQVRRVTESDAVEQGKLHLGYRTYTTIRDADYDALLVFNGIFGAFSHSKLFINVREKASLAYYAMSRLESHQGFLAVMAGIDVNNYEKATTIIREQMDKMKNGDFSEVEVKQTKAMLKNQLLESMDSAKGAADILYNGILAGRPREVDELLAAIDAVSREDVVRVAQKIKLDTIYFLKGRGGQS